MTSRSSSGSATQQDPRNPGSISAAELHRLSAQLVEKQRFEATAWDKRQAPLGGRMWVSDITPGMQLRLADIEDRFGLRSQAELPRGVKIALVVAGSARIRYGGTAMRLGPAEPHCAALAVLPDKTPFARQGQAGGVERTLTLTLSPYWLRRQGFGALTNCARRAARVFPWQPSHGLLSLARGLFEQKEAVSASPGRLALEGFATLLAGEALAVTAGASSTPEPSTRLARLMELIDRGEARGATQMSLAKRLGTSLSTLQRHFYRAYGEALGPYLRRYHLNLAREALVREALSVESAAILAGYANATNFATAFRREFGAAPSTYRKARKANASRYLC